MSISDLRTEFKQLSGLIALTDVECDKWINRGIRHLDRLANFPYSHAKQSQLIEAGQYQVDFQSICRVIESIWVVDITPVLNPITNLMQSTGRTPVRFKLDTNKFRREHYDLPNELQGVPRECMLSVATGVDALSVPGGIPGYDTYVETKALGAPVADGSMMADGSFEANYAIAGNVRGLLLAPPADHEYMLEIFGKWYSVSLSDLIPDNQWSINFPDTIMAAALLKLNLIKYRNTEGAKDYANEITSTLMGMDYDVAEEESNQVERMEG